MGPGIFDGQGVPGVWGRSGYDSPLGDGSTWEINVVQCDMSSFFTTPIVKNNEKACLF